MTLTFEYTIKESDTLESIALHYYGKREIAAPLSQINNLIGISDIRIGSTITLPIRLYSHSGLESDKVAFSMSKLSLPYLRGGSATNAQNRIPLGHEFVDSAVFAALESLALQIDQADINLDNAGYTQHEAHAWLYLNSFTGIFANDIKTSFIEDIEEVTDASNETEAYRWSMHQMPSLSNTTVGMIHSHHDVAAEISFADISYLAGQMNNNNVNTSYGVIIAVNNDKIAGYMGVPDHDTSTGRDVFTTPRLHSFGNRDDSFYTSNPNIKKGGGLNWYFDRS